MDREKLKQLIAQHAQNHKLPRPNAGAYAQFLGLHTSTFSRFLTGKRDSLGAVTAKLLDVLYQHSGLSPEKSQ